MPGVWEARRETPRERRLTVYLKNELFMNVIFDVCMGSFVY